MSRTSSPKLELLCGYKHGEKKDWTSSPFPMQPENFLNKSNYMFHKIYNALLLNEIVNIPLGRYRVIDSK